MTEVATPVAASRFLSEPRFVAGFGEGDGDPDGSGDPNAGTPGGGSGDGSQPGADGGDAFAQERERMQATIRQLQSERDRARAEAARSTATPTGGAGGGGSETPGLTAESVIALMRREREFARAESTLRTEYPYADGSIFDRSLDFDSVEALTGAVRESHESVKARVDAAVKDREQEILKPYIERFGRLQETPPDTGGAPATGDPTLEQLRAMTPSELRAFDADHPGVIDRVMRSATGR